MVTFFFCYVNNCDDINVFYNDDTCVVTAMSIKIRSRKNKGKRLQNDVAKRISDLLGIPCGKDLDIESRQMSQSGVDVILRGKAFELFPFSVEAKNVEKLNLYDAIKQAKDNQKEGTNWLLIVKKNFHEPIVVMDMEEFFKLYERVLKNDN